MEVWFTGAGETSDSFTFHVDEGDANDVLILAETDYTGHVELPGLHGRGAGTPPFLSVYTDAIDRFRSGRYDVYDVDAMGAGPGPPRRPLSLRRRGLVHGERPALTDRRTARRHGRGDARPTR